MSLRAFKGKSADEGYFYHPPEKVKIALRVDHSFAL